jgi:hypothetical protein
VDAQRIGVVWLRANGWRPAYRGNCHDLHRRAIGGELCTGRPMFGADDDLYIDVAPDGETGRWYVWVGTAVFGERFVHVRKMALARELESLYEAMTGRSFRPLTDAAGVELPGEGR